MQEIGNSLKKIREGKGISLEEVSQVTKIRTYYIEAIEKGDMDVMPGKIYAIGFVRSYVEFLGLQEQESEIIAAYKKYFADHDKTSDEQELEAIASRTKQRQAATQKHHTHKKENGPKNNATPPTPIRTREKSFGSKFIWVALILIIIFALLVLYFMGKSSQEQTLPPANTEQQQPVTPVEPPVLPDETIDGVNTTPTPTDETTPEDDIANSSEDETIPPVEGVEVKVTTQDNPCWVSVTIDGETSQETIPANESRTYTGEENITIKYGNPGYVEVEHNGQVLEPMNTGGQVTTVEYGPTTETTE